MQAVAGKIIEALDQSLLIVTANFRLTEIERSQRLAGFGKAPWWSAVTIRAC